MKPDLSSRISYGQDRMKLSSHTGHTVRKFAKGQTVMVRDYRSDKKWIPALIHSQTGPLSYQVDTGNNIWRRHADQLRTAGINPSSDVTTVDLPVPEIRTPEPEVAPPNPQDTTLTGGKEKVESVTNIPKTNPVLSPSVVTRRYPKRENIKAPVKLDL